MATAMDEIKQVQVRPGFLIQNASRATGGITYQRSRENEQAINGGDGITVRIVSDKTVDHVEAVKAVEAVNKKADYACRKLCTRTTFGWFCTDEALPLLRVEFDALRLEAVAVNQLAEHSRSERRVTIGYIVSRLDIAHEDTAREVARTVREALSGVRDALLSGAVTGGGVENKLRAPLAHCKGLDKLAIGIAGDAVRLALASIAPARVDIKAALDRGLSPESAGASVDLGAIENAIAWFQEGGIDGDASGNGSSVDIDPIDLAMAACS